MSKFDASQIVRALDWDFTKFNAGKGEIPEPTSEQVQTFYQELEELTKGLALEHAEQLEIPENASPLDIITAFGQLTMGQSYGAMMDGTIEIYAKLCSNSPSAEQLRMLPARVRSLFFQWVSQELRPEISGADMKNRNRNLRIAPGA